MSRQRRCKAVYDFPGVSGSAPGNYRAGMSNRTRPRRRPRPREGAASMEELESPGSDNSTGDPFR